MIPLRVIFILVVELCERFCYYTIQGSQKFFLSQNLGYSSAQASSITTIFNTASYLGCLPGGVLGDRFLGRFLVIVIFGTIYVAGSFCLAISTLPGVDSKGLFLAGAFAGVAVGTGGIKPNVCNFGADQIQGENADQEKETFFSYFYWMINIGAVVALAIMTSVATTPGNFGISEDYGYFVSYGAGAIAMAACLAIFLLGSPGYIHKFLRSQTSTMKPIMKALVVSSSSPRGFVALTGWVLLVPFFVLSFMQAFAEEGSTAATVEAVAAFAISAVMLTCLTYAHLDNSWIRRAPSYDNGGEELVQADSISEDDIRMTFQTIPVLVVANTVFNFCYTMMIAPFLSQSCQMDLKLGSSQISGSLFNVGDCFAIVLFIPIFEMFIYPFFARLQGRDISPSQKLVGGFFFAAMAMVSATALEFARRGSSVLGPPGWDPSTQTADAFMGPCKVDGVQYCSNCAPKSEDGVNGIYMSSISGFTMFLPFGLVGLGEIMVNPVLYHYAYALTPAKTKSVVQAVNLIFQGAVPPALVAVFTTILKTAQPNNLNKGHIEFFYYISMALCVLGTPIYLIVARKSHIKNPETGTIIAGSQWESRIATSQVALAGRQMGSFVGGSVTGNDPLGSRVSQREINLSQRDIER
mmetsp:Transcript_49012/g.106748  ORF Transcript_49012/g.106748 Transcript_49012/m.106748 type:complete len:637 (+) Transcript_49012:57-1967(+)